MQTQPGPEPSEDFTDPRMAGLFQAGYWPLCNGAAAPLAGTTDLHERRCLEFLVAYYRINCANGAVLDSRHADTDEHGQRALRREIASATAALENLEDRYAPIGFYGDPVMNDIYYADIRFVRPELAPSPAAASAASSLLAIPGLDAIPPSELQGKPTIRRWNHGEAHP